MKFIPMNKSILTLEKIVLVLVIVGVLFKVLHLPFAGPLIIIALSALSVIYYSFSPALMGGSLLKIKDVQAYSGSKLSGAGLTLEGITLSVMLIGVLFKVQHWPGASVMLMVGASSGLLVFILGWRKYSKTSDAFLPQLFMRLIPVTILSLYFLLVDQPAVF